MVALLEVQLGLVALPEVQMGLVALPEVQVSPPEPRDYSALSEHEQVVSWPAWSVPPSSEPVCREHN